MGDRNGPEHASVRCSSTATTGGVSKKYFEAHERCLLFLLFEIQIVNFINSDVVDADEFENTFGVSKKRYFSADAIDEWTEQIDLL